MLCRSACVDSNTSVWKSSGEGSSPQTRHFPRTARPAESAWTRMTVKPASNASFFPPYTLNVAQMLSDHVSCVCWDSGSSHRWKRGKDFLASGMRGLHAHKTQFSARLLFCAKGQWGTPESRGRLRSCSSCANHRNGTLHSGQRAASFECEWCSCARPTTGSHLHLNAIDPGNSGHKWTLQLKGGGRGGDYR